ncbi:MAG: hypothetical protein J6I45_08385, partial [Clostridia bacterium]|nr:hypothetical protein [Clostridia bacterium]
MVNSNKFIQKVFASLLAVCISASLLSTASLAGNDNGKGNANGSYTVIVHVDGSIADNKEEVTITLPDGSVYTGEMQGSKLTFSFPTKDNGFTIPAGGLAVEYSTESGNNGSLSINHQEGNGKDIVDEHDQGANNYRANIITPVETEPVETEPVETEPVETEPVETKPVETEPVETKPVETKPVETEPVETEPVETESVETEPVETEPVETEPVETKPVETEPVETEPVETEPVETKPVETEPVETEPVETESVETEPV